MAWRWQPAAVCNVVNRLVITCQLNSVKGLWRFGAVFAISHVVRPILPRVAVRAERALSGRAEGKCKHVGGFYFRRSTHGESFGIAK